MLDRIRSTDLERLGKYIQEVYIQKRSKRKKEENISLNTNYIHIISRKSLFYISFVQAIFLIEFSLINRLTDYER